MRSVADAGRVPPAIGVIVSPVGLLAGFLTVRIELIDVVCTNTAVEICEVPVLRPATV